MRDDRGGPRVFKLLELGLFQEIERSIALNPLPMSDAVVFERPFTAAERSRRLGLDERFYHEYRLLIDDELFTVVPLI